MEACFGNNMKQMHNILVYNIYNERPFLTTSISPYWFLYYVVAYKRNIFIMLREQKQAK